MKRPLRCGNIGRPKLRKFCKMENTASEKKGQLTIGDFRLDRKGSRCAFFDVTLPSGLIIKGMTLHECNSKWWVAFPSKEYLKPDLSIGHAAVIYYRDDDVKRRFQAVVLAAIREAAPDLVGDADGAEAA